MTANKNSDLLKNLILIRFLTSGKNNPTPKSLSNDLYSFFEHQMGKTDWETFLSDTLQEMINDETLRYSRKYELTEKGEEQVLRFLGLRKRSIRLQWRTVKTKYLPAIALGISPGSDEFKSRYKDIDNLRGEILRQKHNLNIPVFPTLTQATDAWIWKQLGIQTDKPFSKTTLLQELINWELKLRIQGKIKTIIKPLCQQAVDARNSTAQELQAALIRSLIDGSVVPKSETLPIEEKFLPREDKKFNIEQFAKDVIECASQTSTGWFGEDKIFISHIWQRFKQQPEYANMEETDFKTHLTEANHQGSLSLAQADMIDAMNSDDVRESETRYLNSRFHFLRIGRGEA